jgi:4-amino-4-deoxy-L-arabinose transferase-like glycosyltransferase
MSTVGRTTEVTETRRNRTLWLTFAVVAIVSIVRVLAIGRVFSATLDEPTHLISGLEYLQGKSYTADPTHPPLARIVEALPLYLRGAVVRDHSDDPTARGNSVLYGGRGYVRNLAAGRAGNALFLVAALLAAMWWSRRYSGDAAAVVGMVMFAMLPAMLAHSALITTDAVAVAGVGMAVVALEAYLDSPSNKRALILGIAIAAGLASKFSFLSYFGLALIAVVISRFASKTLLRPKALTIGIAAATAFLVVWGIYKFDVGTMRPATEAGAYIATECAPKALREQAIWFADHVPLPAPLLVDGMGMVKIHNSDGHLAYLFGEMSQLGWWYYFPVVIFYKTPLPLLAAFFAGCVTALLWRRRKLLTPVLIVVLWLAALMGTHINIGIRHALPLYLPMVVIAADGAVELWRRITTARPLLVLAAAWLLANSAMAHPDYLAWFNELAGEHPEQIAVDSNLDWGQDALRLAREARRINEPLHVLFNGSAVLQLHGMRGDAAEPFLPQPGWWALSLSSLAMNDDARRGGYVWLNDYHYRMIGKSIRLYHVPECPR